MSSTRQKALAKVRLHPFVIVMGSLGMASAGREVLVLGPSWVVSPLSRGLGRGLMVVGALTLVFSYGAMARARTTINPRRLTRKIVTSGIYRFSRNPIYLGWFLVILGGGLEHSSLVPILVAPAMVCLLHWAVVLPEEEYLEDTFGDEYVRYKRSVRRWL